jgi:hypothetical protein
MLAAFAVAAVTDLVVLPDCSLSEQTRRVRIRVEPRQKLCRVAFAEAQLPALGLTGDPSPDRSAARNRSCSHSRCFRLPETNFVLKYSQ